LSFGFPCIILNIMKVEIYYFSSSGNTLLLAKDGAERLGGRLIPISSFKTLDFINSNASVIGFYFPVYHALAGEPGIPYFIRDFIRAFRGLQNKYVFALCSHSGFPGTTLLQLDKILQEKGASLAAAVAVGMGSPFPLVEKIAFRLLNYPLIYSYEEERAKRDERLKGYREKIDRIDFYGKILRGESCRCWYRGPVGLSLFKGYRNICRHVVFRRYRYLARFGGDNFRELTRFADRSFTVSGDCVGCGLCSRLCPVGNIDTSGGKPMWLHRCENCFSCYHWCPVQAIGGPIAEYEKMFHHPEIKLRDILNDNSI
jgi:ferredoxin/flavodoxin